MESNLMKQPVAEERKLQLAFLDSQLCDIENSIRWNLVADLHVLDFPNEVAQVVLQDCVFS